MKQWLINLLTKWLIKTEVCEMTDAEMYAILAQWNQIDGSDRLLRSMISNDVLHYFAIPESQSYQRGVRQGMTFRAKYLLKEMEQASEKLKELVNV